MLPATSVQLYSLREQTKDGGHVKVLEALGKTGFTGVETAGLYGLSAKAFRQLAADNGLVISSSHGPLPTEENLQEVIETNLALGCRYAISGFWDDDFADDDALRRTADKTRWAAEGLAPYGLVFALHNHWQEFRRRNCRLVYDLLIDLYPGLTLQIDTYWAANFGAERPAEMVAHLRARAPLLHLKDGSFIKDAPLVACGSGKQDFPAIVGAADPRVLQWAVVELDHCATDMLAAVQQSYRYLVGSGLAGGRVKV